MNRRSYSDGTTTHASGSYFLYDRAITLDMEKRKGRYIDLDTANVARLGPGTARDGTVHDGLFDLSAFGQYALGASTFVIGDVFGKGAEILLEGVRRKASLPVLYYRADTSGKVADEIYDFADNNMLVQAKERMDQIQKGTAPSGTLWNRLADTSGVSFYDRIRDPRASTANFIVPHKPDSYILISAGADGLYGTYDDIHNFPKR